MLKIIGIALVLCGSAGFGIGKATQFYRQMRQLREFYNALEILKCEMNYSLAELPKLCRLTAKRSERTPARFLLNYAEALETGLPRTKAAQRGMENLNLPADAQMTLLELFGSLGRYELAGENRLIQLSQHRLKAALERCEQEKKPLAKGYAALGICTGIALVILMV